MFNLHDFTFKNLVNGYRNGSFTKEQVSIFAVNYMAKCLFTQNDIEKINEILSEEVITDTVEEVATDTVVNDEILEDVVYLDN